MGSFYVMQDNKDGIINATQYPEWEIGNYTFAYSSVNNVMKHKNHFQNQSSGEN